MIFNDTLLQVSSEEYDRTYKELEITSAGMQKAIEDILEWYKFQPHLPSQPPDRRIILTLLLANKMSAEKVKSKIDMKCTLRGVTPELFSYSEFFVGDTLRNIMENVYWIPLPKLNKDLSRVSILKIVGTHENFNLLEHFKRSFMVGDYRLRKECCLSDRYVLDLEHLKLSHFTRINPLVIRKSEIANTKAYGTRISGIHILNAPTYVDKLMAILRQALKPKLAERIITHPNLEDMYRYISLDILPKEYGGNERSLKKLNDEWYETLTSDEAKKMFKAEESLISIESKRLVPQQDADILGIQGSFRKLEVD